jgi:leucyl-tRNA---protein transferase
VKNSAVNRIYLLYIIALILLKINLTKIKVSDCSTLNLYTNEELKRNGTTCIGNLPLRQESYKCNVLLRKVGIAYDDAYFKMIYTFWTYNNTMMTSIPLLLTAPHSCSYLEGEQAQTVFVSPSFELNTASYSQLIAHGFRRSGDDVYRPRCAQCSQCVPVRLPVAQFKPNRSQKRCLQKNRKTTAIIKPSTFDQAHYDLYLRYQNQRHAEGSMAHSSPDEYIKFLGSSWCTTQFIEFFCDGELAAVAIVDRLYNALSAVYTFFDPTFSGNSLGVYAVLWQIQYAQEQNLEWLYLGYWIADCQKMNYKDQYQPLQGFINQQWDFLDVGKPVENIHDKIKK